MNTNIIREIKRKIEELQELITRLEQPHQTKLDYVNLSEGNNEDKLSRMTEQIAQYDINILTTPKDSQLVRCAIVNELADRGMKYWHIIRAKSNGYDEAEQTKRYVYLLSRRDKININFGTVVNRYKDAIDKYNRNLNIMMMETTKQSVERSGNLNPMWNKKQSLETKKKISNSQKKRYAAIRKAIREQDILQLAHTDDKARKELIHQLLDKNNISFDNIQQAVNFVAFCLKKSMLRIL